ncbi:hypothetical protein GCM10010170_086710 [Dactylosporangium salmoneum]|uniref:Uncharacterized protein n=1 Tax=Dactylosporangium salmoneum TaxID=53361 RepID=A0ABN3HGN8_9ACTN
MNFVRVISRVSSGDVTAFAGAFAGAAAAGIAGSATSTGTAKAAAAAVARPFLTMEPPNDGARHPAGFTAWARAPGSGSY